jgi:sugar lactone lactonase YvrE
MDSSRVSEDGTQEVVVGGLMLPNGIAFEADGSLLVITGATSPGEPMGTLLRCEGIAAAADVSEEVVVHLGDLYFRS